MPRWYVFDTIEEAEAADARISQSMSLPILSMNMETGTLDPNSCGTERWCAPRPSGGKWLIREPEQEHRIDGPNVDDPII
jgi:hypothetical protein